MNERKYVIHQLAGRQNELYATMSGFYMSSKAATALIRAAKKRKSSKSSQKGDVSQTISCTPRNYPLPPCAAKGYLPVLH